MFFSCPFQRQNGNTKEREGKEKGNLKQRIIKESQRNHTFFTPAFKHVIDVTMTFLLI